MILTGKHGSKTVTWEGEIVRSDGAFDPGSRQLFVVAQVDDPYTRNSQGQPPLKVNQFVQAEILGHRLEDVFVIPRSAVRDNKELLLIDAENKIRRRAIQTLWRDTKHVVVKDNLKEGEILCLTPMTFAADGATVRPTIDGVAPKREKTGRPGNRPNGKGGRPGGPGGKKPQRKPQPPQ